MEKEFCTYEIALALKELGFDEPCLRYYNDTKELNQDVKYYCNFLIAKRFSSIECNAPLWQQVINWFRTEYDIHIGLTPYTNPAKGIDVLMHEYTISTKDNSYEGGFDNAIARLNEGLETKKPSYINLYNTYEEAREKAILKSIELCKKNSVHMKQH